MRSTSTSPSGTPALLLVSVAAVGFVVLVIGLVGITNAGWAVALALIVHMLATAVVVGAVMRMLDDSGRARA